MSRKRTRAETSAAARAAPPADDRVCRICFAGVEDGPLVQPCACRGTSAWAHAGCLEQWRRSSPKWDAAYRCGQCLDEYRDALSLELLRERLESCRFSFGERAQVTLALLNQLGLELGDQGKDHEALPFLEEALQVKRETLGSKHPETMLAMHNLASTQMHAALTVHRGRREQMKAAAEALCHEALEARREVLGADHRHTLSSLSLLSTLKYDHGTGDVPAAIVLSREVVEARRRLLGDRDAFTVGAISNLGVLLQKNGELDEAEPLQRHAVQLQRAMLGDRHPDTLSSLSNLGHLLEAKGDLAGAIQVEREVVQTRRDTNGNQNQDTYTSICVLGIRLKEHGEAAEALELLREFASLADQGGLDVDASTVPGIIRELEASVSA